jgi:hypothetical protein
MKVENGGDNHICSVVLLFLVRLPSSFHLSPLVKSIAELGTEAKAQEIPRACCMKHVRDFVEIASVRHL